MLGVEDIEAKKFFKYVAVRVEKNKSGRVRLIEKHFCDRAQKLRLAVIWGGKGHPMTCPCFERDHKGDGHCEQRCEGLGQEGFDKCGSGEARGLR